MKIKPAGKKIIEEKLAKLQKYGPNWTREYLKSTLDYFCSTFLTRYLIK